MDTFADAVLHAAMAAAVAASPEVSERERAHAVKVGNAAADAVAAAARASDRDPARAIAALYFAAAGFEEV